MNAAMNSCTPLLVISALAWALTPASPAHAQLDSPSFEDQIEEAERLSPREPGEIEAFAPEDGDTTEPVRPGLTEGLDWLGSIESGWSAHERAGLLSERVFVNGVRGRVIRGPHEMLIFIPAPGTGPADGGEPETHPGAGESGRSVPAPRPGLIQPVLLLPCSELDRFAEFVLDDATESIASEPDVLLTGQVFLYNGRNYVLPTVLQRAYPGMFTATLNNETDAENTETGSQDPAAGDDAAPRPGIEDSLEDDDPDVEALIADLERRPPYSPSTRPTPAAASAQPDDGRRRTGAGDDGEYLAALRGRLERAPDGTWSFVIDTDRPRPEVPGEFTLLPCRTLHSIEQLALRQGDSAAGELSGRVYRFRGRLYMLPTLFQRERRDGVDPLQ